MIAIDTSVVMKWFKQGERYESEAEDLRHRVERREIDAGSIEILSLEVARGLKNAQGRQPSLGITDANIEDAYQIVEGMFRTGILVECQVSKVKTQAKAMILSQGLFTADALHLAAAVNLGAGYFVVDDKHFLTPEVVNYALGMGVQVVSLPDLLAALNPGAGSSPTP